MNWPWFNALCRSRKTRPGIRSVGLVLAIRAKRDDPTCNPSVRSLSRDAAVGHTTVVDAIRYFENAGLLTVERQRGKSNLYRLTVPDSGTPSVPELGTVTQDTQCSPQRNTQAKSVPHSGTPVFPTAVPKGKTSELPPKQEEHGRLDDAEVPY